MAENKITFGGITSSPTKSYCVFTDKDGFNWFAWDTAQGKKNIKKKGIKINAYSTERVKSIKNKILQAIKD